MGWAPPTTTGIRARQEPPSRTVDVPGGTPPPWRDGRPAPRTSPPAWHHTLTRRQPHLARLHAAQRPAPRRQEKTPSWGGLRPGPGELRNGTALRARHIETPAKLWLGRDGPPPETQASALVLGESPWSGPARILRPWSGNSSAIRLAGCVLIRSRASQPPDLTSALGPGPR
jgi:hypothetical protein